MQHPWKVGERLKEPFQPGDNALPWVPALHMNAADTRWASRLPRPQPYTHTHTLALLSASPSTKPSCARQAPKPQFAPNPIPAAPKLHQMLSMQPPICTKLPSLQQRHSRSGFCPNPPCAKAPGIRDVSAWRRDKDCLSCVWAEDMDELRYPQMEKDIPKCSLSPGCV